MSSQNSPKNWKEEYINSARDDWYLYHQPYYLDAVTNGNWDVVRFPEEGQAKAFLPYVTRKERDGNAIVMPPYTAFLGPVFLEDLSTSKQYAAIEGLLDNLPDCPFIEQRWNPSIENWLPAYWKNFEQQTRYTYIIDCPGDEEQIWKEISSKKRNAIRKAEKNLTIEEAPKDVLLEKTSWMAFLNHDKNALSNIIDTLGERGQMKILGTKNDQGEWSNLALFVWDKSRMYYLVGLRDNSKKDDEGMNLLLWTAMKDAPEGIEIFDFEGSMIKGIETFFRLLGGKPQAYFQISKSFSRYRNFRKGVSFLLKALKG